MTDHLQFDDRRSGDHIPQGGDADHDVEPTRRKQRPRPGGGPSTPPGWRRWIWPLGLALVVGMLAITSLSAPGGTDLDYSAFLDRVEAGEVETATIEPDGTIRGELADGGTYTTVAPTGVEDSDLVDTLQEQEVTISSEPESSGGWAVLLANLLPLLLIGGVIWWFVRRSKGQMGQLTSVGKSKAKVLEAERPDVGFDDVAGYDGVKQEVREVIDYLRDPSRYEAVGARGPGGVLLVGPPGTGKTLLARAVAGEADVPFISAAGSEFVEMLVGVGASRVRDLFEKAREKAPAIIFIDELDSIGRKRGGATTIGSNNEQEQTLNQLLAEMDGFDPSSGVVVIAATNRPEMLDEALLRPGRFDRQIEVPAPTQGERLAILRVHTRGKPLGDDVDLEQVARGTPGFSGAQLENVTNEAAIVAVRADREELRQADFEEARDRVILGRRQDSDILRPEERRRVAVHEAGHAVVAALCEDADPVSKVTILPTRRALGVTEQLPLDERRLYAESWLRDSLRVRMGGRVAELELLDEASSGAANDLATATDLATRMVRDFGLSDEIGPVGYASEEQGGSVPPALRGKPYAEETQRALDEEVARLLREAEDGARALLRENRDALEALVARLEEDELVDGDVVYELVGRERPGTEVTSRQDDVEGRGTAGNDGPDLGSD